MGNFFGRILSAIVQPIVEGLIWVIAQTLWGVVRFALEIIDGIVKAFEWLLFQNWNTIIFGTQPGEFAFFPSPGSPLFTVWISMFSFGLLLLIIFFTIVGLNRIKEREFYRDGSGYQSQSVPIVFTKVLGVAMGMFFVPFALITGMNLTSGVTRALFQNDQVINSNQTIVLNSDFAVELNSLATNIYTYPADVYNVTEPGSENGLVSHQNPRDADLGFDQIVSSPRSFSKLEDLTNRFEYELNFLNAIEQNKLSESNKTLLENVNTSFKTWQEWLVAQTTSKAQRTLTDLSEMAQAVRPNMANSAEAARANELKEQLKEYVNTTNSLLENLHNLVNQGPSLTTLLSFEASPEVATMGRAPENLRPIANLTDVNQLVNSNAIIALRNIDRMSRNYMLGAQHNFNSAFNPYDETSNNMFNNLASLKGINSNLALMLNGYGPQRISLFTLAEAYAPMPTSGLVLMIYRVMTGDRWASDWNTSYPNMSANGIVARLILGFFMITTIFVILGQLIKRLVIRFAKIAWLWIMGLAILPSTIMDDTGGRGRAWLSMVVIELLSLFAMGAMWFIWKALATPLANVTYNIPNISDTARGVVLFFVIAALLEVIVQASDWLSQMLGANSSFGDMSNIAMTERLGSRILRSPLSNATRWAKEGNVLNKARGANKLVRGSYDPKTAVRYGGVAGKNGLVQRYEARRRSANTNNRANNAPRRGIN